MVSPVFANPFKREVVIDVRRDVVANGGGFTRDVVVHPGAVGIIALDDAERVRVRGRGGNILQPGIELQRPERGDPKGIELLRAVPASQDFVEFGKRAVRRACGAGLPSNDRLAGRSR